MWVGVREAFDLNEGSRIRFTASFQYSLLSLGHLERIEVTQTKYLVSTTYA